MATNLTPRISPSSISDLKCAKRFHTLRVLKQYPPREPLSFASFGTSFHEIMGRVYDPRNGPAPNLEHLEVWSRQAFRQHRYADDAAREEDRARCVRMVRGYVEQDDIEDALGTICTEQFVEHPVNSQGQLLFILSGRFDRVIERAHESDVCVTRDYKLSRPRVDLEASFITLWLAKLTYPGYRDYRVEWDFVDEGGRVDRETVGVADVKGMHAPLMDKLKRVLASEDHPAEPSEACAWCVLKDKCLPQVAAAQDVSVDVFA